MFSKTHNHSFQHPQAFCYHDPSFFPNTPSTQPSRSFTPLQFPGEIVNFPLQFPFHWCFSSTYVAPNHIYKLDSQMDPCKVQTNPIPTSGENGIQNP